jgi:hypothetical protein
MATTLSLGTGTLCNITTGSNNLVVGNNAGLKITTGTGNIYLGNNCGNDQSNESNTLRIGPSGAYIITGNLSTGIFNAINMTSINLTATTNQIVMGTTKTTTLSAVAPGTSQTITIPDQSSNLGTTSTSVLTTNTITYIKTGTWTPTLGDGTHNFTLSTNASYYSIIGDTTFFTADLAWSSINSATGQLQMSLPSTAMSGGGNYRGAAFIGYLQNVTYTGMIAVGVSGTSATFINIPSNGTPTAVNCTGVGASGQTQIWGFYRTA